MSLGTILVRTLVIAPAVMMTASTAVADVVTSDDVLRIRFTVDADAFNPGPPDVMRLNFGVVEVLEPMTSRIAELYDGNTLLGTASPTSFGGLTGMISLTPVNSFHAPGSVWCFDDPVEVDFTSILDGTIDGRIDWHPETGSVDVPLGQISLSFLRAKFCSGGTIVTPAAMITSIDVISSDSCPEDLDGNGVVDFSDVLRILSAWGNMGGPEDLNGNGIVEFGDIVTLLSAWGACP